MSAGEFKKRAVREAVIDVDDIRQTVTEDRVLTVEVPEEKYMVRMKELFAWLDESLKEFPTIQMAEERFNALTKEQRELYSVARSYYDLTQQWSLKWLGKQ